MTPRLHPQIAPHFVRPTRDRLVLCIELAPVAGDPVMPLKFEVDPQTGARMLADLTAAFRDIWLPAATRNHGVEEQKSHVRPCDPL